MADIKFSLRNRFGNSKGDGFKLNKYPTVDLFLIFTFKKSNMFLY